MSGSFWGDPTVTTARCAAYDPATLRGALRPLLETLLAPRLPPGARVLVKPNLLRGCAPERAVTTHPELIAQVCAWLVERGCDVTVGDSPGLGSTRRNLRACGGLEPLRALGVHVEELKGPVPTRLASGVVVSLSRQALEAEVLLNLAKWKTHVQAGLTAGVKNLFGCVVGSRKALLHVRGGHREREFAAMLASLPLALRPALTLVDGVVAMEGDGPFHGTPKAVGYLVAGRDPYAVDARLAQATGFARLPMLDAAAALGAGGTDPERVPLAGAGLPAADALHFKIPRKSSFTFNPIWRVLAAAAGSEERFEVARGA